MILNIVLTDLIAHQLQRIATVKSELPSIIHDELIAAGSEIVGELVDAAPRSGSTGSTPAERDASGPLAESFTYLVEADEGVAKLTVKTLQPNKLKFVRYGTGIHGPLGRRIYPKVKRALHWDDKFARSTEGQEANDFVAPITDSADEIINDRVSAAIGGTLQLLVS